MSLFKTKELTETQEKLKTTAEELATYKTQFDEVSTKLSNALTEIETLKTSNVSKASYDELQTKFAELATKHEELEKKFVTAEAKASEIIANQGCPPVPVNPEQTISKGNSVEDDMKVLSEKPFVTQSELQSFLKKHSKNLNATAKP